MLFTHIHSLCWFDISMPILLTSSGHFFPSKFIMVIPALKIPSFVLPWCAIWTKISGADHQIKCSAAFAQIKNKEMKFNQAMT